MRQIIGENWHISVFDFDVYKMDANLIHAECVTSEMRVAFGLFGYDGEEQRELARYIAVKGNNNSFTSDIDLSEYVRMIDTAGAVPTVVMALYFWNELEQRWINQGDDIDFSWNVVGLYNPMKLLRHPSWVDYAMQCRWAAGLPYMSDVFPPRRMLYCPYGGIVAAFQNDNDTTVEPYVANGAGADEKVAACVRTQGYKAVVIPMTFGNRVQTERFEVVCADEQDKVYTMIDRAQNVRDTVLVRWEFPTGAEVRHMMEIRDFEDSVNDSVSMDVLGEGFDVRKGIGQTFVLHLDNLDPYDYWYYGTIATSNRVFVQIAGDWRSVNVLTKKLEQPNTGSGKLKSLDIEVKLNDYKAV